MTTIRRKDEVDAELLRRLTERAGLISGCRRQQENSLHALSPLWPYTSLNCSGLGSAQQYQGSLRNGTGDTSARTSAGVTANGIAARSWANAWISANTVCLLPATWLPTSMLISR